LPFKLSKSRKNRYTTPIFQTTREASKIKPRGVIELLKEHIPNGSNKLYEGVIELFKERVPMGLTKLYEEVRLM